MLNIFMAMLAIITADGVSEPNQVHQVVVTHYLSRLTRTECDHLQGRKGRFYYKCIVGHTEEVHDGDLLVFFGELVDGGVIVIHMRHNYTPPLKGTIEGTIQIEYQHNNKAIFRFDNAIMLSE